MVILSLIQGVEMPRPASTKPHTPQSDAEPRRRNMAGPGALLGGPANVIMQLSLAPVGRGVVESTVDSGRFDLHPRKRGRTTLTYLAVAMLGTDEEREAYRAATNTSHLVTAAATATTRLVFDVVIGPHSALPGSRVSLTGPDEPFETLR